jgi:hypothetical protein
VSHGLVDPATTDGADTGPVRDLLQTPRELDLRLEESDPPWVVTLQLAVDPVGVGVEVEAIEFVPEADSEPTCGLGRYFGATFHTQVRSADFTATGETMVTWRTTATEELEVFVRGQHALTPSPSLRDDVFAEAEEHGCDPADWEAAPDDQFWLFLGDGDSDLTGPFPGGTVTVEFDNCKTYQFNFGSWNSERGY